MFVSWFLLSVIWKNELKLDIFVLKYMFYEHTILNKPSTFEVALCYTTSRLKMIINSEKDTTLYIHTTLFLGQALLEPPRITPEVDLYRFLTRREPSWSRAQKNETKYTMGTRAYWSWGMIDTDHSLWCHVPSTEKSILSYLSCKEAWTSSINR